MRPTLSPDQRHLLALVGCSSGTMLLAAMIDDSAMAALLARSGGASMQTALDGAPEWMTSYWTSGQKFTSPGLGTDQVRCAVTATQVRNFGRNLPLAMQAEIRELEAAQQAEAARTWQWCYCPYADTPRNSHVGPCTRYHPSAAEHDEHYRRDRQLSTWSKTLLNRALGLAEAGAQLDLFAPLD
ncbi:hypothetical protein [Mycolicibacterium holsaticum]|uniref:Uncharacterized protein n=1 Tax=Mycolicibacterium holsaticum TaxID=152142 RepID=A0A1E3S0E7_9MYCO|nr:hypothetical protein [Mycolicibacterium holsaticum]ODQ95564.1 hypothetical protein BHQ17_04595 [Mycolicibacterium holsaticum]